MNSKVITNFDSVTDVEASYDPTKNKTRNILTTFEKTNVIGLRLEQLAFGAKSLLSDEDLYECKTIHEVVETELEQNKLPFIICRNLINSKEYWKLSDLHIIN